jgi:hypothetical protein
VTLRGTCHTLCGMAERRGVTPITRICVGPKY